MRFSRFLLLLLGIPLTQMPQTTGIKMTIRLTMLAHPMEETIYLQNDRKRMEYRNSSGDEYGPHLAAITRCDLGQGFTLNLDSHEYTSAPYPPKPYTKEQMATLKIPQARPLPLNKTLRIETTTVDTGERKEMFGHTARHVITTRKETPLAGSHSTPRENIADGWYIDLDMELSCDRKFPPGAQYGYLALVGNSPPENPEFVSVGKLERGFGLQEIWTMNQSQPQPDGTTKMTSSRTERIIKELLEGPLDPALFEIPSGFKLVAHVQQMPPPKVPSAWERFKARFGNLFHD
jgi:hypothetical protein